MKKGDSSKVVVIEPGIVTTIDGKKYYNEMRIIAGSPEDVEAYKIEHQSKSKSINIQESK